jgi:hypothetical protein
MTDNSVPRKLAPKALRGPWRMMKKPVQVQDYEKDKDEDEGEVILTSLMGVPVRCKAISGMYRFPRYNP